jgi:hypothetical protein
MYPQRSSEAPVICSVTRQREIQADRAGSGRASVAARKIDASGTHVPSNACEHGVALLEHGSDQCGIREKGER